MSRSHFVRAAAAGPFIAVVLISGCGGSAPTAGGSDPGGAPRAVPVSYAPGSPGVSSPSAKIRAEDGAGKLLFELSPSAKGYDVSADGGRKLGTVKVEADRVKASDERGRPAFKVKQKEGGFKRYREPAGAGGADIELAHLRTDADGFKIKDAQGRELFQGKTKEAKTKVTGPGGASWKLKAKDDGLEVEDAAGKRLIRVKGLRSMPAAVFCAAPRYSPLQKATVAAYCARIAP
ncbi:MAG TPA: hypothetical protein VK689_02605 [Armatimonadota bacterium]|nr:hypothetical protein [Armatimonadota bacterium]